MDSESNFQLITATALQINTVANGAKINGNQSRRFASRLNLIVSVIKSRQTILFQNLALCKILKGLAVSLNEPLKFISKFRDQSVLDAHFNFKRCRQKFTELREDLRLYAYYINHCITIFDISKIFNPIEDRCDRASDFEIARNVFYQKFDGMITLLHQKCNSVLERVEILIQASAPRNTDPFWDSIPSSSQKNGNVSRTSTHQTVPGRTLPQFSSSNSQRDSQSNVCELKMVSSKDLLVEQRTMAIQMQEINERSGVILNLLTQFGLTSTQWNDFNVSYVGEKLDHFSRYILGIQLVITTSEFRKWVLVQRMRPYVITLVRTKMKEVVASLRRFSQQFLSTKVAESQYLFPKDASQSAKGRSSIFGDNSTKKTAISQSDPPISFTLNFRETGTASDSSLPGSDFENLTERKYNFLEITPSDVLSEQNPMDRNTYHAYWRQPVTESRSRYPNGSTLVVKKLPDIDLLSTDGEHFIDKLSTMSKISHDNVVSVYGACLTRGNMFLAMEYVGRGDLQSLILDPKIVLPWSKKWIMIFEMVQGIKCFHLQNLPLVHSNIKSSNFLVADDWTTKISDPIHFGIQEYHSRSDRETTPQNENRLINSDQFSVNWESFGRTVRYMAPELLEKINLFPNRTTEPAFYSLKMDIYSLGVVMWELATRKLLYNDESTLQIYKNVTGEKKLPIPSEIPAFYARMIEWCCEKDPLNRPTIVELESKIEVGIRVMETEWREMSALPRDPRSFPAENQVDTGNKIDLSAVKRSVVQIPNIIISMESSPEKRMSLIIENFRQKFPLSPNRRISWTEIATEIQHRNLETRNAEEQFRLGFEYANGVGVEKDETKAAELYRKAAEQGHMEAQHCLGIMYADGEGVQEDFGKAIHWFSKAADQGDVVSQVALGFIYSDGDGVEKNPTNDAIALKYFQIAAEQGDSTAQVSLGFMYIKGQGMEENVSVSERNAIAKRYFQLAAEQGHSNAQYSLWAIYSESSEERDLTRAIYWLRKAAKQGHVNSQFNLGIVYTEGDGVERDPEKALYWFSKAAEQGHLGAQSNFGAMCIGDQGVEKDLISAIYWLSKAANRGSADAQYNIGIMCLNGLIPDVDPTSSTALEYFQKAAGQEHVLARQQLIAMGQ